MTFILFRSSIQQYQKEIDGYCQFIGKQQEYERQNQNLAQQQGKTTNLNSMKKLSSMDNQQQVNVFLI